MKRLPLRLLAGSALVAMAATLVVAENSQAWSTIGGSLGLNQRDFRIYDNFTDSSAHNNTTAHANWPGYTEVEMACWKGGAEWGSRAFGDGTGDSTQSNVGDGNANFNFFWNGEASGVGGTNDNINSGLSGSSGGVLAYTETPIADGWRIRYYEAWTWHDGPGSVSSGIDFQGVACHELGHALGLGHTSTWGATMYPSISGTGVGTRSIHSDDQAGLQNGIYGARDDARIPRIDSISGSFAGGGTAVITGANFTTTANRVWLNSTTLDGGQGGGDPYEVSNLDSTNGQTQISFTVPNSGVESGGLHVRKGGSGHDRLSEGHPFEYGGGSSNDTINLSGPTSANVGDSVNYDFDSAPASSPWWFYYALNANGTTINGQAFDIGTPYFTADTGTTDPTGAGSFSGTIPPKAAGRTVYLEVRVDNGGSTFDSNMLTLVVN
ncbi:MAG: hypothetical protein DWQ01_21560 [Planctomycetota bacterium]|nr:MAG: hypothetical protein DWQ01_21560 [Planctomycetota bacterium]